MSETARDLAEAFGSSEPQAVFFDCDGILLDTQALWDLSISHLLDDRGVALDERAKSDLVGRTVEAVVTAVAQAVGEDPYAVGHELGERYKNLLAGEVPVLPGAFELVEAASRKVPVVVVSNTPRRFLVEELADVGILPLLDHVVSPDDVAAGKPAPDMYVRACELTGVAPATAVVFEDSETGARAARDAGIPVVAAPIIPGQEPEATVTVSRIGDPDLTEWINGWAGSRDTVAVGPSRNPLGDLRHFYPSGVVFDCDGLILDTESVWEEVQQSILRRHHARPTPEQESALMGSTLEQAVEILADVTEQDYEVLLRTTRAEFAEAIAGELRFMPGAKEFVELVAAKVPIAAASNSWHTALVDKLSRAGVIELFHNLQSADTVPNGKPAPDMYAKAVDEMGLNPADCLAFEDSPVGGRAAKSAGLRLVGVPSTSNPVDVADATVASLEDPALLAWVSSWPNRSIKDHA